MVMGEWNGKKLEVTPKIIKSLQNLKSSFKVNVTNNNDDSGSPPTQTKSFELQPVTFEIPCSASAGVDVRREFDDWMRLAGESAPLYIGGQQFGPDLLMLQDGKLGNVELDPLGRMLSGVISLSFKEDAEEAAGQKGRVGSYLTIRSGSAVSLGASSAEKNQRAYTLG